MVGGWTAGRGARRRPGALLVGYWDGDTLRYAGKGGTGFDSAELERFDDSINQRDAKGRLRALVNELDKRCRN